MLNKFKNIICILLVLSMAFAFASCGSSSSSDEGQVGSVGFSLKEDSKEEAITLKVAGLKGPTSMGMVKLMEDCSNSETKKIDCEFTLAGSADEITPLIIKGELDIAAVPANLAAVLYNKSNGQIQLLAVNTLGVLYIVSKGEQVNSFEDLKGKTIYATGKGSTPEYTLRYLLLQNGIDPDKDLAIEFKSEASEVVALMTTQDNCIAMLPQPYVTAAQSKVEGLTVALDLTAEWDKVCTDSSIVTGVLIARRDIIENYPNALYYFLTEYENSVNWVKENNQEAAQLIEKYDIIKAAIAEKALPYCNLTYLDSEPAENMLKGYYNALYNQNPKSIGGTLPDDGFYVDKDNDLNQ